MELSLYLAQLIGVVMVVVGLAFLLRTSYYQKLYKNLVKEEGLIFVVAWLILIVGLVLVMSHNVWVSSWEVIITLLAWGMLIKGVLLLLVPAELMKWTTGLMKGKGLIIFGGLIYVVLGAVLIYFGYFV